MINISFFTPRTTMAACLIIPAYNEDREALTQTIRVAKATRLFDEIIMVDDGSWDGTTKRALREHVKVVRHRKNKGKPAGIRTGLRKTKAPIVCIADADMRNITKQHFFDLVLPVACGCISAQIALFRGGMSPTVLAHWVTPGLSGQRCFRRELLKGFDGWDTGYGFETALNDHFTSIGADWRYIPWVGVTQWMKEQKKGSKSRGLMYWEIIKTWIRLKRRAKGGEKMRAFSCEALGLCVGCGCLLVLTDMATESIDADWICPNGACGEKLTHDSFGYTLDGRKVRWVGPGKQWVDERPTQDFALDECAVCCD